jgi:hypothetical protein
MRRDMDLVRSILLNLEGEEKVDLTAFTQEQVGYHSYLVMSSGLAYGADVTGLGDEHPSAILTGLTWEGHDFLDAARSETIWKKVMNKVKDSTGTVAFEVLKALLIAASKEKFGLT